MVDLKYNVAGSESNSYVSRDEMTAWVDEQIPNAVINAWKALGPDDQKRFLIQACRAVDRAHEYLGQKVTDLTDETAQALKFPRMSLMISSGDYNLNQYRNGGSYIIDERVKRAQMLQALHLCKLHEIDGVDDPLGGSVREQLQAEGVTSIQIGNTSEDYNGKAKALCAAAEDELRPLIRRVNRI